MKTKTKNNSGTLKNVLSMVGKYKPLLIVTILLSLLYVAASLYIPILAGKVIDVIADENGIDFKVILQDLVLIGISAAVAALSQWLMSIVNNAITYRTVHDLREKSFKKLMKLPISFIDSNPQGEIVSRIIADTDTFADGLLMGFTQLFTGVATIAGTIVFMLTMSYLITLAVVILTPISLFAAKFIATRTYSMFKKQSECRAEQTAYIDEMIQNQKTVKAFGYEKRSEVKFDSINEKLKGASLKATFYSSLTNPVTRFVNSIVYMAVVLLGAVFVIRDSLSVGMLVSFLSYANQYTKPFNEISGVVTELQNALACAQRVFDLLSEPEMTKDGEKLPEKKRGEVVFNDVSFSYTQDKKLIENFNLKVIPGQKIAIVGPTGCGKTTLINLLMRFYDVDSGSIVVDGVNINDMPREALRGSFGMVLQETWLKSGTVKENLKMGKPDATDEEMIEKAKLTRAHSFIKRLPEGYDTLMGESGGSLSEGQKQLLCITRVMLMDPPMLILDEATSSIDTRTEMKIQQAFDILMKGKTAFVVAHRLSTIQNADKILVMNDGKIIETGTHNELLSKNGFYSKLFNSQFAV
ncbi:MAG: ABC transporter ATP-binding protein/permease [Oscillospiraceae bacterium]|nr:ABC transporter ATP-binding protein/permease [Oscillospiraceae bacterium]